MFIAGDLIPVPWAYTSVALTSCRPNDCRRASGLPPKFEPVFMRILGALAV